MCKHVAYFVKINVRIVLPQDGWGLILVAVYNHYRLGGMGDLEFWEHYMVTIM